MTEKESRFPTESGSPFYHASCLMRGEKFFVLRLIPRLQRLHALVRPGEGLLLHVLCQLVAEVGVGRGLERVAVVTLDLLIAVAEVEVFSRSVTEPV